MGMVIALWGIRQFVAVTLLVWLVSGIGVWLVAPANTITVGASGLVFGWLAFLIARGIFSRSWQQIVVGVLFLAVYGSLFWTGIVSGGGRRHHGCRDRVVAGAPVRRARRRAGRVPGRGPTLTPRSAAPLPPDARAVRAR